LPARKLISCECETKACTQNIELKLKS